jgi:hypothetical protein
MVPLRINSNHERLDAIVARRDAQESPSTQEGNVAAVLIYAMIIVPYISHK